MGCAVSKGDDSPLLSLCKERNELIMAATDCRYALASSHILYIRSLLDVGVALSRFVDEGVVGGVGPPQDSECKVESQNPECNNVEPCSLEPNQQSPISVCNGELFREDAHLVFPPTDSDSDSISESGSLSGEINLAETELHGPSSVRDQSLSVDNPNASHVKWSMQSPSTVYEHHPVHPVTVNSEEPSQSGSNNHNELPSFIPLHGLINDHIHPQDGKCASSSAPSNILRYDLMHSRGGNATSFGSPMNFLREDLRQRQGGGGASLNLPINLPTNDLPYPGNGYKASFDVESDSPSRGIKLPLYGNWKHPSMETWQYVPHDIQIQNNPYAHVLVSDQPELINWDYLSPFNSIADMFHNYYFQDRYETDSGTNIPDFSEVRQREGIPDLEDESEQDPAKEVPDTTQLEGQIKGGLGDDVSKTEPPRNRGENDLASVEGLTSELPATEGIEGEDNTAGESSPEYLESETLEAKKDKKKKRSLQEVVKELNSAFVSTFNYGKEVSMLLEAGNLPYQYTSCAIFKVIYFRIQGFFAPASPTHLPSRQSIFRSFEIANGDKKDMKMDVGKKSSTLSSTLEKLCAWEKKLYKEIKNEETLRAVYDKQCKKLKDLAQRGADSSKLEVVSVLVKKLLLKINVSMTTLDAISRRINKLRDEELLLQLSELIHGLIRMWTFMADCHRKQLQEIMHVKPHVQVASSSISGDSGLRATLKLERECLKWEKCFGDWIKAQKSFVKLLNNWLLKCIIQEQEVTADGIAPFSPGRVGAPGTFIVCNDWYQTVHRNSESHVSETIHNFALSLHRLWEKQSAEWQLRVKAEFLLKDYERRARSFYEERGIDWSDNVAAAASEFAGVDAWEDLESLKKRMEEQRIKHGEATSEANNAASTSLRSGMISIFEALERFCLESMRGYKQIRDLKMKG